MDIITLAAAKKYTQDSLKGAGAVKGQDGKSAYQIWLDEGNIGSEQDFLNNLKGEKGDKGEVGPVGPKGEAGKVELSIDKIDLIDKPFDDTDILIELPTDTSNCTMISSQPIQSVGGIPVTFIKVSESVFKTAEDIIDVVIKVNYEAKGRVGEYTVESSSIYDLGNGFGVIGHSKSVDGDFPFFMDIHTIGTVTLPTTEMEDFSEDAVYNVQETGLYFLYIDGMAKTLSCKKDNPTKLEPNIYYSFGEVATLALEFSEGDSTKVNEYMFSFISGETATILTLPSSVQWANELTIEANKRYEISIIDNIGLWCAVDLAVSE